MSLARQVGLLAAGCQPWNMEVVASSEDRFAYCATLAIYVYQLDRRFNEFKLISIMSEHKKTITALAWNPRNPDLFASSSTDNVVIIWNVSEQKVIARLDNTKAAPCSIGWSVHEKENVSFVFGRGPFYLWNYNIKNGLSIHKEAQNFMADVCQFRWHPKKMGKLAFGHMDGSLSLFCPGTKGQKHILRPENIDGTDEEDPITALEWDPLSMDYLLVSNTHNSVRLVDSEGFSIIMVFQLPSAAAQVHTLDWINSAPGMFVTGDTHTGVMRLWNVSRSTPIENIRLKKTGFHALTVFSTAPGTNGDSSLSSDSPNHSSSTSLAQPPCTPKAGSHYALPPAHALCTFLDGGVGLYDLGRRKWHFLRDLGHVETIFDCHFKPDNSDLLATGSFDGTIKVWDVSTLKAVYSSPGNEGVIYCLSWAPSDLNCIAASTSKQGAFIWDLNKGKIIKRFTEHGKFPVYSVAWNQKDLRRIATAAGDGFCIIRQMDGQTLMKYKHPGPVYGCDWNPHNKDMLATGCEDKNVRVFYLATNSEQPLKVFSGHSAKVFNVRWSPLKEGLLCSGSDDCTIRVWDYTQECCTMTLQGHNGPVRGLLWNSEVPYILISGSWDYTIRIWDTRDGACLDRILDHGADVYGLTCHPDRPFVLASSSRDSTVRIWSLTALVQPLVVNVLAKQPWDSVFANPEHCYTSGSPPLMIGRASRELKNQVEKMQGDNQSWILEHFSKFFSSPAGVNNLWDLVAVVKGRPESLLGPSYRKGLMHHKHVTKYRAAEAQELEMAKVSKFGGGLGAPSKEERLKEAASIHIKLGNTQRYCELMVELGEWEKALSIAPGVSMAYWKSLAERRVEYLIQEDSDQSIPYCVATGNAGKLIDFLTSRGRLQDALLGAAAANEGSINPPGTSRHPKADVNGIGSGDLDHSSLLLQTSQALADWHFRNGSAVTAACCHLVVDDCKKAMSKLVQGNELELAVSVGHVLGSVPEQTDAALGLLARRCERIGQWELAVNLLKQTADCDMAIAQICSRFTASVDEINSLHERAGIPLMAECLNIAQNHMSNGNVSEAVKYYMLSPSPEEGLELGLKEIKGKLSQPNWTANDVFPLLQLIASTQMGKLQQSNHAKYVDNILAYSAYIGALVAVRRQYDVVVSALLKHTLDVMRRPGCDIVISQSLVQSELDAWKCKQSLLYGTRPCSPSRKDATMTIEQRSIYEAFVQKGGKETSPIEAGPDIVSGSNLPSHSDVHQSVITGQRIQGPAFFLEDGRSVMSVSEAMMWAKVNPFSPLGSGAQINPF